MIQEKTYPRKNRLPVLEKVIVPRTRRSSAYVSHFLLPTDAQKEDVELLRIQVLGISNLGNTLLWARAPLCLCPFVN